MAEKKISICRICHDECKDLGKHSRNKHGVTPEEYYEKYLFEGYKINMICEALGCNNTNIFLGINKGYSTTCSKSCARKVQHTDPIYSKLHADRQSERMIEMNKNSVIRNTSSANSYISKCESSNISDLLFYIIKGSDYIKIGICFYLIGNELHHFNRRLYRVNYFKPISYELFTGNYIEVVRLEEIIKNSFIPIKETEYFSLDLYGEIKSKIPNTILPYSTLVV